MSLTTHPYRFFSDFRQFIDVWGALLDNLSGEKILCVWGVWDSDEDVWFDAAPMLAELSSGIMSIHVKCERDLAIGWNDIFYLDKPIWFDTEQLSQISGLGWHENLVWKAYDNVTEAFGCVIKRAVPIQNGDGLIGLSLLLNRGAELIFYDAGDVIAAKYEENS